MSALYRAGEALGFSPEQVQTFVQFWNLNNPTIDQNAVKQKLQAHLLLSDRLIEEFLTTVNACTKEGVINYAAFCEQLWSDQHALEALAMLQYFQQRFFTKGEHKEEFMTKPTAFTEKNGGLIQDLASRHFQMIGERNMNVDANVTFMFGATSKTCQTYINNFLKQSEQHQMGTLYMFLSTRTLKIDTDNDDPEPNNTFVFKSEKNQRYIDYLQTHFLERYNAFMATRFPELFNPVKEPCEGMAMLERYQAVTNVPFEKSIETGAFIPVYTATTDSIDFYRAAAKQAYQTKKLPKHGTIALSSIQPYCLRYSKQMKVICQQIAREDTNLATLSGINCVAYGPSGRDAPELLAQRLAVSINIAYDEAVLELQKTAALNHHAVPKNILGGNYKPSPVMFFVSSNGDTQLALQTANILTRSNNRQCIMVPLTKTASDCIAKNTIADRVVVQRLAEVLGENIELQKVLSAEQLAKVNTFISQQGAKQLYIGMPSQLDEEKALQLAQTTDVACTFAYEHLFQPAKDHRLWAHKGKMEKNTKLRFATPVAQASKLFASRTHVISHSSFNGINQQLTLNKTEQEIQALLKVKQAHTFISGTTQPHEVDAEFVNALLTELVNHPTIEVRFGIHPGVSDMGVYLKSLLSVCHNHQNIEDRFKIILSPVIKSKMNEQDLAAITKSEFMLQADVSGTEAAETANRVAQAVPGALTNRAVIRGKPTYYHREKSHLPLDWFAKDIATFFQSSKHTPHKLEELELDADISAAEALARKILG